MSKTSDVLPVDVLRGTFLEEGGPIVITAPTGSGKSTQVPRWAADKGDVVVVEPRRVACRALASRVAHLEKSKLGGRVGFQVRGETQISGETRIRFVTPGIALQQFDALTKVKTVILDELHERRLDVDLLAALLLERSRSDDDAPQLVVMSATLDGPRVAKHMGARLLEAEGRLFPVDIQYRDEGQTLPSPVDLEARVLSALRSIQDDEPGDVLVFLPGKGEIAAVEGALRGPAFASRFSVVMLHGGMSLDAQARVFERTKKRKVVLATNVAETSLTVPGIRVVIDSGLVRRTSYHHGRAHLAMRAIALDAADQRAGRAGRMEAGRCIRLWARRGSLDAQTPPEVHRESLVPLVLSARACGADVATLPLLDAPKEHALADAMEELLTLGALDEEGALTSAGRELAKLPIDAALGRLLVEARRAGEDELQDMVDLVAAMSTGRRMFHEGPGPEDTLRAEGCDALALIRALRSTGGPVDGHARREGRLIAKRLRGALGLQARHEDAPAPSSDALCAIAVRADPRCAHVVRRRGKGGERVSLAGGGTELSLARESAAWRRIRPALGGKSAAGKPADACVVFDVRAFGTGRDRRLLATTASPCSLRLLRDAGLAEARLAKCWLVGKRPRQKVKAEVEWVFAGKALGTDEVNPKGDLVRSALFDLASRGTLFRDAIRKSRARIDERGLAAQLATMSVGRDHGIPEGLKAPASFDEWLRERILELGIESGDELEMLSPEDFLAKELPFELQGIIADLYPREVSLGDATYKVSFDLEKRQAILNMVRGTRKKPPPRSYLPKFPGLRVFVEAGGGLHRVS
ncbi:MAG: helicase-related protein [Polyangiales bacterium]